LTEQGAEPLILGGVAGCDRSAEEAAKGLKKQFVLTPRAEQDIGDIWDYIAAADRVLTAVEKSIYRLAKTPGAGHLREDLADGRHRFLLVYLYLIIYRFETKPLQVIRVFHASRDVQSILGLTAEE